MSEWRLLAHVALETRHQYVEEEVGTGIRREVHTPRHADGSFGKPREYYYHPSEPRDVTHDSYAEALAAMYGPLGFSRTGGQRGRSL